MKRIFSLIVLIAVLGSFVFSMSACGKSRDEAVEGVEWLYERYCKDELESFYFDGMKISYYSKSISAFRVSCQGNPRKNEFNMLGSVYFIGPDMKSHTVHHKFVATYNGTSWEISNVYQKPEVI